MTGPATTSRSTLAVKVTWPRAILWRSSSRISPSHRAKAEGSLRLGLKNLWLTVLISTLARASPMSPSAEPNPVMLDIMWSGLSYGAPMSLSIPKIPSDTVDREHARHLEPRNHLVLVGEDVPLLVAHDRTQDADLEQCGQSLGWRSPSVARDEWEDRVPAVLVHCRRPQLEVPSGKALEKVVREVDL